MTDPIRAALERAARELELSAIVLRQGDFETFAKRAQNEAHAARATLLEQLATAAPADGEDKSGCARIELVTAIYCLASHFEIACSDLSGDDLQKARNDIAHARCIAAKHNQNGPGCAQFLITGGQKL